MKKIKNLFKKNVKLVIGIIIGVAISGGTVYAATILFNSNQVGYDNTSSGMSATNVQDALDELYSKAQTLKGCTTSPFHLGDYISMTPTSTTFTTNTAYTGYISTNTLNPSELSVWRVIKINPDCTVEVVSEYASSTNVCFKGKVGYQNYIYYLNEIAKQYANTTYTLDPSNANTPDGAFRNVGYDGQTKQITNTTRLDDATLGTASGAWYEKPTQLNGEESLGGGDLGFLTDLKLMEDAGVILAAYKYNTTTPTSYFLASRHFYSINTSSWHFNVRYVYSNGPVGCSSLYMWGGKYGFEATSYDYAVRPIVTLKSGLTVSGGSGTKDSPYTLS